MFNLEVSRLRLPFFIMSINNDVSLVGCIQVSTPQNRLVLIGGGHAHVQVLKGLNKNNRPENIHVTLIDSQRCASYSGMVPGCVAKLYSPEQTLLQLEPLCRWADIEFIHDEVTDIDMENRYISVGYKNEKVPFDVISFDIGCRSRGLDEVPGALQYSIPTRPISKLVERIDEAEKKLENNAHLVVVGGGAAGIELAMCMRGRWGPKLGENLRVTILNASEDLFSAESAVCRAALENVLRDRNIEVKHECTVREVTSSEIIFDDGGSMEYTHCLWATGATAHSLSERMKARGIAVSDKGWIRVNAYLQSKSHSNVFAAGDCCTIEGLSKGKVSPPKAGVYAVRSGPVLVRNLVTNMLSKDMIKFQPQDDFLKLLACGDGKALGFRFGIPIEGKWVFELKDHIDQMFMNLFKEEYLPKVDEVDDGVSEFDAQGDIDEITLSPTETATLLLRKDDDVDYLDAWHCIRAMSKDDSYRMDVLEKIKGKLANVK